LSFGIGTNLTNNTKWTWPRDAEPRGTFGSFSVVIKPSEVMRPDGTWVSTVKLSDNPNKAVWSPERVALFKEIFWAEWMETQNVSV
jgi:nicotinic acid phosphoribosyltransferase